MEFGTLLGHRLLLINLKVVLSVKGLAVHVCAM